jgi:hypothetical protein
VFRIERWRLPEFKLEGASKDRVDQGELAVYRLAGTENFLVYQDRLIITDRAMNVQETIVYPEALDSGSWTVGVSSNGRFAFIDGYLRDQDQERWYTNRWWHLISPDVVMGEKRVFALGSYHSGRVVLTAYDNPEQATQFDVYEYHDVFLSPDEKRLLIVQRNGLHRLIDVETQAELERWRISDIRYDKINWRYNRLLAVDDDGAWSLHQIEPHQLITEGPGAKDGSIIVAKDEPVGVYIDDNKQTATLIDLHNGGLLATQKIPELADSYRWLQQRVDSPLAYSQRPLTLLFYTGMTKEGIEKFKPYRLEIQPSGKAVP